MTGADLERRVARLEACLRRQREQIEATQDDDSAGISRRRVLQGLGLVGVGLYASEPASADPQGQLGTVDHPVETIYAHQLAGGVTGGTTVTSLVGPGLSVDGDRVRASVTDAASIGSNGAVFTENADGILKFRSIEGGDNVTVSERSTDLLIDADISETTATGTNLGSGIGVYAGQDQETLEFRSLTGGSNVPLPDPTFEAVFVSPLVVASIVTSSLPPDSETFDPPVSDRNSSVSWS